MTLRRLTLAALLVLLVPQSLPAAPSDRKPNVLVILTDDLGINDLGCYGRADQPTPHIDRLAAGGMRFTSAYCAQPICSPSRAALMTGLAPARLRLTTYLPGRPDAPSQMLLHPDISKGLTPKAKTIAERLGRFGYVTALSGKWHLGDGPDARPRARGFDVHHPGRADTEPSESEGGKGEYDLTAHAERFIADHKDRPFFLVLAHNTPHVRLAAKAELAAKHKDAFNPVYAAMIQTLDDTVGRLMAKLDELKLAENTLVIFTSDNGGLHVHEGPHTPATHNTPFRAGKGYVYEGGLRVPLIVRFPGRVKAGVVTDAAVVNTDWTPTWLELAGVEPTEPLDGVSLVKLLTSADGRDAAVAARPLYWHFPHYTNQGGRPAGAIREGDWKLIEHYEDGRAELFNLAADVGETTDLSMKEPARTADLRGKLAAWRQSVAAQENTPNPDFQPALWKRLYADVDTSNLPVGPGTTAAELHEQLADWRRGMNVVLRPPADAQKDPELAKALNRPAGLIVLHAKDAAVHGQTLRYEDPPQKNTLGYWTNAGDWASWDVEVKHAGTYSVHVLQGCGQGSGGAEVEVTIDDAQPIKFTVQDTGHFQNFVPRAIGTMKLEPGKHTLAVKPKSKPGVAVMDLRRVTLVRAPAETN